MDGYDQIQVANNATVDGTLQVALVNDYVPEVGTEFQILTYGGTLSNAFADAEGLFSFPDGDRYFEIVEETGGLKLVVTAGPGEFSYAPPEDAQNGFGEFLNDYFGQVDYTYAGSFSIAGFVDVVGNVGFTKLTDRRSTSPWVCPTGKS